MKNENLMNNSGDISVSVIVPTYQEAANLPALIDRLAAVRAGWSAAFELIIVDDNSQDGSAELVAERGLDWATLVTRTEDRGLSSAVMEGFRRSSHEIIVVMDADLSHPPEKIPLMVDRLLAGDEFVIGSRFVKGGSTDADWGLFRWLNSKVATLMARPFTNVKDPMAGFFCFRSAALKNLKGRLNPIGYKIGLEVIVKAGFERMGEVPIHFTDRQAGESKLNFSEQLRYIQHLRRLMIFKYGVWSHLLQFLVVGFSGMIVNLTVLTIALLASVPATVALLLAIVVSMLSNFVLNRRFSFSYARQGSVVRHLLGYCSASAVGAALNYTTALLTLGAMPESWVSPYVASLVGIAAGTGVNFLLNRFFVFKQDKPQGASAGDEPGKPGGAEVTGAAMTSSASAEPGFTGLGDAGRERFDGDTEGGDDRLSRSADHLDLQKTMSQDKGSFETEASPFTTLDAVLALVVALGYGLICGRSALHREWFNQYTETDYLHLFLPETRRLLAGQPLDVDFHPPLYAATLAAVHALGVDDWLHVGLLVSVIAIVIAAFAAYYLMHQVAGRAAALGAVLALGAGPNILGFGIQATSDIFFLAIYTSAFAALAHALRRNTPLSWGLAGFAIGLTLMARTNGIILLPLLAISALPWLSPKSTWADRGKRLLATAGGFALPLAAWFAYALPTGSPIKPDSNHLNLALTFYGPAEDRVSIDSLNPLREQFTGTLDVMTHDPAHILKVYTNDLVQLPGHLLFDVMPWPIVLLALPGLVGLFRAGRRPITLIILVVSLLHIFLLNCKAWDPRFYYFLVPIFGGAAGYALAWLWKHPPAIPVAARRAAVVAACLGALFLLNQGRTNMWRLTPSWLNDELAASVAAARDQVPAGSVVQSRKPHMAYYLDAAPANYPTAQTAAEYDAWLHEQHDGRPFFVYVGLFEQASERYAPYLQDPDFPPTSLEKLAEGPGYEDGVWTLYRFHPNREQP
eukprot:g15099.t1